MADNQPTPIHNQETPEVTPIHNHSPESEAPKSEPVKDNSLAEQFSRVVKQEKFVAEERKKIEEAKKAFENDKQEVTKYRGLKGKNPFEILEHFGVSYEDLVEADKNRRSTPMDPMAKKALETVEQLRMELETKEREAKNDRDSRAEIRLMSEINTMIRTHEYDLIEKLGEEAAVRALMEEKFQETGEIPDIKEACEEVTARLVNKYSTIRESKWLKPKEPVVEAPAPTKAAESLSNKMVQSSVAKDRPLTEKERIHAAIQAINALK